MKKILFLLLMLLCLATAVAAAEQQEEKKWPGVDETVVGKYAKELGRAPRSPFIDINQGDLPLFLFTLAGGIGGFIMGYYWHKVFVAGKKDRGPEE
jgi:cobalt/nickel transport protein